MSKRAFTFKPLCVSVAAMRSTMTSWLVSGCPRQFTAMCENKRCSILFQLLVPGGMRRHVQAEGVGETLKSCLPPPEAIALAAAAVSADE